MENSNVELLQLQGELSEKIQQAVFGDEVIEKLRKQLDSDRIELEKLADKLSANRKKTIPAIESEVLAVLTEMGMGNASIKIDQIAVGRNTPPIGGGLGVNGLDIVRFLFTANKGHSLAADGSR